jgi:hypothetical protein
MPSAFVRIRTSFSCTSISRLVASASCQLPVGIEQWPVVIAIPSGDRTDSVSCQWGPDEQLPGAPVSSLIFEADTLFPTDNWQLAVTTRPTLATLRAGPHWQLATDTDNCLRILLFFLIRKGVGPCVRN